MKRTPHPPRLRTILTTLTLVVLLTPLAGIFFLRIYDTELIRQTEAELIAQAAFIQADFGRQMARCAHEQNLQPLDLGPPATPPTIDIAPDGSRRFRPVPLTLDLRTTQVFPESEQPTAPNTHPIPCAVQAGTTLVPSLVTAQEVTHAGMRVVDSRAIVVASTRHEDLGLQWRPTEVQQALDGHVAKTLRTRQSTNPDPPLDSISRRGGLRVFVSFPIWLQNHVVGAVVVSRTPVSLQKALYTNKDVFLTLALGLLALTALFSALALRSLDRPVRGLMRQIQAISEGQATTPISPSGTLEFARLSDALTRMDDALRARNNYIRDFARNVSHEFKTPLTSIQGAVELLEEFDQMPQPQRQKFLHNIGEDARRLERLVNRLHELARAETTRSTEFSDVLPLAQELALQYQADGFDVAVQGEAHTVAVAPDIFDSMLRNLVENARVHGKAPVQILIQPAQNMVFIDVTDAGPGIPAANLDHIFDTFFTTAREQGGTGLGLSIVRAIAEQHGGSLTVIHPCPATFRLSLPAHPTPVARSTHSTE